MSKRRSRRTQPNLPQEVLDRARREAGLEPEIEPTDTTPPDEEPRKVQAEVSVSPRHSDDALPQVQRRPRRKRGEPEVLTSAEISERLAHPTKHVTEDELRSQYIYVLKDLRGMSLLAAVLFVVMIAVAQLL
jgi:hypothetical protein